MPFGNKSKKYWIVPQEALSPDDLQLGSLLKRPNDPIDLLNRNAVEQIEAKNIVKEREQVTKSLNDAISNGFGINFEASSILAAVLGASPDVGAELSRNKGDTIEATRVRAQHFIPPEEYMNKALSTQQVVEYTRQSFFTAPVYMVVGVAVARTLVRTANNSRNTELKGGFGLGPPGTGIEISANISGNHGKESVYQDSVDEDVVLAYRLRRFRYSKVRGRHIKKKTDETGHAMYRYISEDVSSDEEKEDPEYNPVFSYFEDDDVAARDVGMEGFVEAGEEEEEDE
ncbi:hypothetical protein QQS21_007928 [Conoideocrella luteorostrata]|uniref:Uncharacterized protein n=1 Tax=Conoideocrella luteorostrata TaxID=1105319 RepID=A0AAJ0CJT4_9HYPO|nr:hypothetical protein QQS21_007928 [Conoideocrella luteorostrata]